MALTTPLNTVYLLNIEEPYEGDNFLGAFSSLDKAMAYTGIAAGEWREDRVCWYAVKPEYHTTSLGLDYTTTTDYRIDEELLDPKPREAS
jgi:hypothetical protein